MPSIKKKFKIIQSNLNFMSQQLQILGKMIEIKESQLKEDNSENYFGG